MTRTVFPGNHQVCVVDDDPLALQLVSTILAKKLPQVQVLPFSDPLVAETWLEASPPQLLICDLEMSERNGFHLLKRVKSLSPFSQVIVLTGHCSMNALTSAIQLGADEFFVKPFKPDVFLCAVHHLIARSERWQQLEV